MYTIKVKDNKGETVMELKSDDRKLLKPTVTLFLINGYPCQVIKEAAPTVVKIKGID